MSCYIVILQPKAGAEVLYVEGQNNGKAIYEPNGFPYIRLDLDPMGKAMRKKSHHTIHEVGFHYLADLVRNLYALHPETFSIDEEYTWNGRKGQRLLALSNDFKIVDYTVGKDETLVTIARKLYHNEHKMLEMNDDVKDYDDVDEGQVIKIPNIYAKQMELFIDDKTGLPLVQKLYDEQGLLEQYVYTEIELNITLPEGIFDKGNLGKGNK